MSTGNKLGVKFTRNLPAMLLR